MKFGIIFLKKPKAMNDVFTLLYLIEEKKGFARNNWHIKEVGELSSNALHITKAVSFEDYPYIPVKPGRCFLTSIYPYLCALMIIWLQKY